MIPVVLDILKFGIEQYLKPQKPDLVPLIEDVTVVIPAHNEEECISSTLDSVAKLGYAAIVVVNGSTDRTAAISWEHPSKPMVIDLPIGNKTVATEIGLKAAKTRYVLIIDADTALPEEHLKRSVNDDEFLMAYPVIPLKTTTLVQKLQDIEYKHSMFIGKPFTANNVLMASGACVLGEKKGLKALPHSGVFAGEDKERSLVWHLRGKPIVYDRSSIFKTDAPATLKELIKQRRTKWNPGGYRLLPLMMAVLIRRGISWRLRLQILYEILAILGDPIKVVVFFILFGQWLIWLYAIYVICSGIMLCRVGQGYSRRWRIALSLLYPGYATLLMMGRLSSLNKKLCYKSTRHRFPIDVHYRLNEESVDNETEKELQAGADG